MSVAAHIAYKDNCSTHSNSYTNWNAWNNLILQFYFQECRKWFCSHQFEGREYGDNEFAPNSNVFSRVDIFQLSRRLWFNKFAWICSKDMPRRCDALQLLHHGTTLMIHFYTEIINLVYVFFPSKVLHNKLSKRSSSSRFSFYSRRNKQTAFLTWHKLMLHCIMFFLKFPIVNTAMNVFCNKSAFYFLWCI